MSIQILLVKSYQVVVLVVFSACMRTIINALLWTNLFANSKWEKALKFMKKYLVEFAFLTLLVIATT
jgi:hypothetical protein